MRLIATSNIDGKRIDIGISLLCSAFSRSAASRLLEHGCVLVNGSVAKKKYKLNEGDVLEISEDNTSSSNISAENIPLSVLFEDKDIIVVEKPAGMLTHPTAHVQSGTLVNALLFLCGDDLSRSGPAFRPGIVHRLDRDTSGVLMVAKNDAAHRNLAKQIEERAVTKTYLALLAGDLEPNSGTIDAPLLKSRGSALATRSRVSNAKNAQSAITHYSVREHFENLYSYVSVDLVTGRTHQIRVHFSSIGHPVMGDEVYGASERTRRLRGLGLSRQFLHAHQLRFLHPRSNKEMRFESPLPADLAGVLAAIRAGA